MLTKDLERVLAAIDAADKNGVYVTVGGGHYIRTTKSAARAMTHRVALGQDDWTVGYQTLASAVLLTVRKASV